MKPIPTGNHIDDDCLDEAIDARRRSLKRFREYDRDYPRYVNIK